MTMSNGNAKPPNPSSGTNGEENGFLNETFQHHMGLQYQLMSRDGIAPLAQSELSEDELQYAKGQSMMHCVAPPLEYRTKPYEYNLKDRGSDHSDEEEDIDIYDELDPELSIRPSDDDDNSDVDVSLCTSKLNPNYYASSEAKNQDVYVDTKPMDTTEDSAKNIMSHQHYIGFEGNVDSKRQVGGNSSNGEKESWRNSNGMSIAGVEEVDQGIKVDDMSVDEEDGRTSERLLGSNISIYDNKEIIVNPIKNTHKTKSQTIKDENECIRSTKPKKSLEKANSSGCLSLSKNNTKESSYYAEPSTSRRYNSLEIRRLSSSDMAKELRDYREKNNVESKKSLQDTRSSTDAKIRRISEVLASLTGGNLQQNSSYKIPALPATTISFVNTQDTVSKSQKPERVYENTHDLTYNDQPLQRSSRTGSLRVLNISEPRLQAYLNQAGGFFQIGPTSSLDEEFCFAVTIVFAKDLGQIVSPDFLMSVNDGLCFCYSLLGCAVYTDPFQDLDNPEFLAERAIAKVHASVDNMAKYFQQHPILEVHLVVGDICLATARVDLSRFMQIPNTNHVTFDQPCELHAHLDGGGYHRPKRVTMTAPVVAVSLALTRTEKINGKKIGPPGSENVGYEEELAARLETPAKPMQVDVDDEEINVVDIETNTQQDNCEHHNLEEAEACKHCNKPQPKDHRHLKSEVEIEITTINRHSKPPEKPRRRMSDCSVQRKREDDSKHREIEVARRKLQETSSGGRVHWDEELVKNYYGYFPMENYDADINQALFEDIGRRKKRLAQEAALEIEQLKEQQQELLWKQYSQHENKMHDYLAAEWAGKVRTVEKEFRDKMEQYDDLIHRLTLSVKEQAARERFMKAEEAKIRAFQEEQQRIRLQQIQEEEDRRKQEEGKRRKLESEVVERLESKLNQFKAENEELKQQNDNLKKELDKMAQELKEKRGISERKHFYKAQWIRAITAFNIFQPPRSNNQRHDGYRTDVELDLDDRASASPEPPPLRPQSSRGRRPAHQMPPRPSSVVATPGSRPRTRSMSSKSGEMIKCVQHSHSTLPTKKVSSPQHHHSRTKSLGRRPPSTDSLPLIEPRATRKSIRISQAKSSVAINAPISKAKTAPTKKSAKTAKKQ